MYPNPPPKDAWMWVTSKDGRECEFCLSMNGTINPSIEPVPEMGIPHYNCRCKLVKIHERPPVFKTEKYSSDANKYANLLARSIELGTYDPYPPRPFVAPLEVPITPKDQYARTINFLVPSGTQTAQTLSPVINAAGVLDIRKIQIDVKCAAPGAGVTAFLLMIVIFDNGSSIKALNLTSGQKAYPAGQYVLWGGRMSWGANSIKQLTDEPIILRDLPSLKVQPANQILFLALSSVNNVFKVTATLEYDLHD